MLSMAVAQPVRAPGCEPGSCEFESHRPYVVEECKRCVSIVVHDREPKGGRTMARNHCATDEPGVHVRLAGRIFDVTLAA